MTIPTPTQAPKAGPAHHLWRLTAFATSPEARPALLGALGAVLITTGGLGAGSTRLHDPLLESLHLSWLR
ncbi:MAG TPA: alpha-(1-_6)-mannopyranosyltransferase A, partial [Mycobacterium sp.]|nr:alpha-(1->6)-mannopyranosyltransferase A [Mycobacterium sp.]